MSSPVELIAPDAMVKVAAEKMAKNAVGVMPVADGARLVGMLTDRDIVTRCVAEGCDAENTQVRDVMTDNVYFCFEDDDLDDVAQAMAQRMVRRMPVVNQERGLVGIISLGDLAKAGCELSADTLSKVS